ncbi:aldehyde dehydrogenase family 1 member A3 [Platysternon megacephalum]|uniref:Aldehyde dehydrogenase family 1 member A3 n=1 Tax=Platysternon megacephalum TaxID=55544 RepID=A0A4D9F5G6_9SAUR|nr:aldehyde dehydrogenase family 1 member A3 [Platysternon megacephalum]
MGHCTSVGRRLWAAVGSVPAAGSERHGGSFTLAEGLRGAGPGAFTQGTDQTAALAGAQSEGQPLGQEAGEGGRSVPWTLKAAQTPASWEPPPIALACGWLH